MNKDDLERVEEIAALVKTSESLPEFHKDNLLWMVTKLSEVLGASNNLREQNYFLRMALKVSL